MENPQPPAPDFNSTAAYLRRLGLIAMALVVAQVLYVALAILMITHGFKATGLGLPQKPFALCAFVVAIVTTAISFLVVKIPAQRQPAATDVMQRRLLLQKQFFTGFALSTSASMIGLFLFFVFADLTSLAFLVLVSVVAIILHYLRVKRAVEEIDHSAP